MFAKHLRKVPRLHLAKQDVGVRHRQWTTAPVTGWPGVGTGTLRPDAQARAVESQHRATAGRHGVDTHHRRAHPHSRYLGFKLALELTREMRHVGRGATHVKTDDTCLAGNGRRTRHANDATGRAAQDGVLALETGRIGQATRRLHEIQAHARHLLRHLLHITTQDRRQIGIDHRRVTTPDKLHHRTDLVRDTDLRKPHLLRQSLRSHFMQDMPVAMHENDGHTAQPGVELVLHVGAQLLLVQRTPQFAARTNTLLRFHYRAVEQFGQHDAALKQAGPVLVGNPQRVAKAARGHQQCRLALALQQRIGGNRGSHLDTIDQLRGDGLMGRKPQQMANAGHRGILVLLRVVAQQLVCHQATIGAFSDHVGEGAATVDPELPTAGAGGTCCVGHGLRVAHSEVAARAAWSYCPDMVRRVRATAPMSVFICGSKLSTRH